MVIDKTNEKYNAPTSEITNWKLINLIEKFSNVSIDKYIKNSKIPYLTRAVVDSYDSIARIATCYTEGNSANNLSTYYNCSSLTLHKNDIVLILSRQSSLSSSVIIAKTGVNQLGQPSIPDNVEITDAMYAEILQSINNLSGSQVVRLSDLGAAGDGVTDDTEIVQSAIDSLPNGGYVVFESGHTYLVGNLDIHTGISLGCLFPYPMSYDFVKYGECILRPSSTATYMINVENSESFLIENLIIEGAQRTVDGVVSLHNPSTDGHGGVIRNVKFDACKFGVTNLYTTIIDKCKFRACEQGVVSMVDSMIRDSYIYSSTSTGVNLGGSSSTTISGCKVEWNNGTGIYTNSHNLIISNNVIDRNGNEGIKIDSADDIIVANNLLKRNGGLLDSSLQTNLKVVNSNNITIQGNITKVDEYDQILTPQYSSWIANNSDISLSGNDLTGGVLSNPYYKSNNIRLNESANIVPPKEGGVVCVSDFGAVGDGVADDTQAIQNALDDATTSNGVLYIPAGIYKLTSELSFSRGKVGVRGDGYRRTILKASHTGTVLSHSRSDGYFSGDIVLQNFQIDGSGTAENGLYVNHINYTSINDVYITNCIKIGYKLLDCQDVTHINFQVANCGDYASYSPAAYLLSSDTTNPLTNSLSFVSCRFEGNKYCGIKIYGIKRCRFVGTKIHGYLDASETTYNMIASSCKDILMNTTQFAENRGITILMKDNNENIVISDSNFPVAQNPSGADAYSIVCDSGSYVINGNVFSASTDSTYVADIYVKSDSCLTGTNYHDILDTNKILKLDGNLLNSSRTFTL